MLGTRSILIPLLLVFSLFLVRHGAVGQVFLNKILSKTSFRFQRADFVCPSNDGFFGIPGECTGTYYACVGGTPIPQECPANEVFDPEIKRCVPYASASCNGQSTISTTTISSTTPTTTISTTKLTTTQPGEFTCPSPDGFFPIPGTCDSPYYICVGGVPTLTACPGQTVFDPLTLNCVQLQDATCYDQTFTCPTSEGFYPIPGTCGSDFYVCVSGSPYVSTCPNGNIFDPETHICTPPDQATCSRPFAKTSIVIKQSK